MAEYPKSQGERNNPYHERLLANQPDPEHDTTDDRSRAIRYAKDHYESFYEVRDIKRIVQWLNESHCATRRRRLVDRFRVFFDPQYPLFRFENVTWAFNNEERCQRHFGRFLLTLQGRPQ
jgi:hypothetical protein